MTREAQILALLVVRTSRIHLSFETAKRLAEAYAERLGTVL